MRGMTDVLPESPRSSARIEHFTVTQRDSDFTKVRAAAGHPGEYVPPGSYVKLLVDGQLVMSDTLFERETNERFVREARGDVLVAGLGIGLILRPILPRPYVRSVTVVEKENDVITLVGPYLTRHLAGSNKLAFIHGDINTWTPPQGMKYDTIYFDIWPTICSDHWPEMRKLRTRFRSRLRKGGWMGAWCEEEMKRG